MRTLLDLLLPPHCPGCGQEGTLLCVRCSAPLRRRLEEPAGAPIGMPATMPPGLLQLEWCAMYSGSVRAALHALKYRGERRLAGPLAEALAERWLRVGRGGEVVTWVPVHTSRRRERGFDQAEVLARRMAAVLELPVAPLLERHQRTSAQHALGRRNAPPTPRVRSGPPAKLQATTGAPGSSWSTTSSPPARPSPAVRPPCSRRVSGRSRPGPSLAIDDVWRAPPSPGADRPSVLRTNVVRPRRAGSTRPIIRSNIG